MWNESSGVRRLAEQPRVGYVGTGEGRPAHSTEYHFPCEDIGQTSTNGVGCPYLFRTSMTRRSSYIAVLWPLSRLHWAPTIHRTSPV